MSKLKWDQAGEKLYYTGVDQGVLYPQDNTGAYPKGVAWNGLSNVTKSPSGAEANAVYADNTKYLTLFSAEELGLTIEAYMYPDEFGECDGSALMDEALAGVVIGQQTRKGFGFCYRSLIGNDILGNDYGYMLHLVYSCKASPSEQASQTVNDSPEASSMSWEISTTPVVLNNGKKTTIVEIDSTKTPKAAMDAIEAILYGSEEAEPRLPLPDEVASIMKAAIASAPAG